MGLLSMDYKILCLWFLISYSILTSGARVFTMKPMSPAHWQVANLERNDPTAFLPRTVTAAWSGSSVPMNSFPALTPFSNIVKAFDMEDADWVPSVLKENFMERGNHKSYLL